MSNVKELTTSQRSELDDLLNKGRKALEIINTYSQERVDHLCQAVAWSISNKATFTDLSYKGVDESNLGDRLGRPGKRGKIHGILRDALREKSVGAVEILKDKGIVKYAKPAGLIASVVPATNPVLTPAGSAIYGIKARDVIIFAPHPRCKKTTFEAVEIMREALVREGAPADILQCVQETNIAMSQALMKEADLVLATGGPGLVHSAYSSGTPAYGVGSGNSTMIIDETADIDIAANNTRLSKTSDFGSGCSADGNLLIQETVFTKMVEALKKEGGYLASDKEKSLLKAVMWDKKGHRLADTVAIGAVKLCSLAGFNIPADSKFVMVMGDGIGAEHNFSSEKLTTLLALYSFKTFDEGLSMMQAIYNVKGKGHSCGIYSHSEDHIHRLALSAPVSRIMVRQPQSKANAGAFNNGMPMTSSLGCGTWGGNIVSENVNLKHYLNYTWVSQPIAEDKPSYEDLFGKFWDPKIGA